MKKKSLLAVITLAFVIVSMVTFAFATGETATTTDTAVSTDAATVDTTVATDAATEGDTPVEPAPWYAGLLSTPIPMLVVMFALFYFVLIRPENKRKKETANMRSSLKVGDEITTIGGIIGTITKVKDDEITIKTGSEENKMKIAKWAVSSLNKKD